MVDHSPKILAGEERATTTEKETKNKPKQQQKIEQLQCSKTESKGNTGKGVKGGGCVYMCTPKCTLACLERM